jgi:hypothetical protein
MKMGIRFLRKEHPEWSWVVERYGRNREYVGVCAGERIRVYCVACLIGEDEFERQWRIYNGTYSQSFAQWSMEQQGKRYEQA